MAGPAQSWVRVVDDSAGAEDVAVIAEDVAVIAASFDLNDDGRVDHLIHFGEIDDGPSPEWNANCGNWGECWQGIFAACGDGRFAEVLPADYFFVLELDSEAPSYSDGWRDIVEFQRTDPQPTRVVWTWTDAGYVRRTPAR